MSFKNILGGVEF
jgi:hypothetical protein